jgi:hypothetical protein
MRGFSLPEHMSIVEGLCPATMGSVLTGDYVSLKNVNMAYVVCHLTQGNAATQALNIIQATAVAGTSAKAITNTVPIWSNLDCAAGGTMTRRTDAVNYTTDAGVKHKQVVFQVDPATLDQANGFDCIAVEAGASNVANILGVQYFLDMRYKADPPPTAITD